MFSPLAFTKTFAMAAAALLSVTLVPALMVIFVRGRIIPEHRNPINRLLIWVYRPVIRAVLKAKTLTIMLALVMLAITIWPARQLGSEFMPNLERRHAVLHADDAAGHFGDQGGGASADAGPHHQVIPGGRVGLWQGRAGARRRPTRRRPRCSRPSST